MAKDFKTLVRMRKWALDEKQRELGEMLGVLGNLEAEKEALEQAVLAEQKVAAENPELAGFAYGGFANAVIAEREAITKMIAEQEEKIDVFREEVADAFKELKTAEIAERNRLEAERAEEEKKEQDELDEIGMRSVTRDDGLV
ncbi:flagellar FliJ family protein [Thalassospira australica]|uniref:flagellar FliJ family protein n=1 Tax=Thalassospira australica TaxID=1528106 RepID=UPI00051A2C3E|nr:flagellar FliJ family protein [Thalassospira australica]